MGHPRYIRPVGLDPVVVEVDAKEAANNLPPFKEELIAVSSAEEEVHPLFLQRSCTSLRETKPLVSLPLLLLKILQRRGSPLLTLQLNRLPKPHAKGRKKLAPPLQKNSIPSSPPTQILLLPRAPSRRCSTECSFLTP